VQIDIYDTTHLNTSTATSSEACHEETVISASGSGLAAFVCGHATASAATIDIFIASSRLWIAAHRSASALVRSSPLPRDYAGQSGQDGQYGTNAHLACVAGKVILMYVRPGEKGVSVEIFSGVDGSIMSESFLSSVTSTIFDITRQMHVDAPMHVGLQHYQRHGEEVHLSQRETVHGNLHDDTSRTPGTFDSTFHPYVDTDITRHNKNDSEEEDRPEKMNRNGRIRKRQLNTRGRQSMEDRHKGLMTATVTRTREFMSSENLVRWKMEEFGDGDGVIIFAGGACVKNFWNCTSRTSTQWDGTYSRVESRRVYIYDNVDDPLRETGSFLEYTFFYCEDNVLTPVVCSVDAHTLDVHTGTFSSSPFPLNISDNIFEVGSMEGSSIVVDAVNMSNSFWRPSTQVPWKRVPPPPPTFGAIPLEGTGISWPANVVLLPHTRATSKESVLLQSQSVIHFVTEVRLQSECVPVLPEHQRPGSWVHQRICQVEGWIGPETSYTNIWTSSDWRKKDYKVSFYRETLSFNVVTGIWSQPMVVPKKVARLRTVVDTSIGMVRVVPSFVSSITLGNKLLMVWQDTRHDLAELIIWDVLNEVWSAPVSLTSGSLFDDTVFSWTSNFYLYAGGEGVVICQCYGSNGPSCTNVDSAGFLQSPSAVIEVSTDKYSMSPTEVYLFSFMCLNSLWSPFTL